MNLRKITAALVAAALLAATFGCTSVPDESAPADPSQSASAPAEEAAAPDTPGDTGEPVKLRFMSGLWDGTRKAVHDGIQAAAAEQFPHVEVEYEMTGTSGDWLNKLKTYNATGDMPDVFFMASSVTFPIINAGNVVDLMPYVQQDGFLEEYYPDHAAAGVNDNGTLYALSEGLDYYFNPCIFYNTALFQQAGVDLQDTSWNSFIAACDKLKAAGLIPITMCDKDSSTFTYFFSQMMIMQDNPQVAQDLMDNKTDWSNPVVVDALDRISGMVQSGYFPEDITSLDYGAAMELFNSGQAAMYIQMSWDIGAFAERDDVGLLTWPHIHPDASLTDYTISWSAPNAGYAVYSKTANLPVAVEFAEMCAFQAAYSAGSEMGQPSVLKTGLDVTPSMSALAVENMRAFEAVPNKLRPYGNYWFSSKMFSEFAKLGSQLLTGQYSGQQFAEDIAPAWETNFEDIQLG